MLHLKSLNYQLTDLRMSLDVAIVNGDSFAEVKKIYAQLEEVEKLIVERQLELLKIKNTDSD